MQFFIHLLYGFLMAFIGVAPPGMLNMTSLRIKIKKNKNSAFLFALGAATIVIPQALIALSFTKYFTKHPEVIERLKIGGFFVLLGLSVFFFFQARKKIKAEGTKKREIISLLGCSYPLLICLQSHIIFSLVPSYMIKT